ncbi:MAG: 4-(cytidine 5'-diphospho)-2-C-methyl-D-erythritol kinase [Proteobacteria bacterium]|nr:4-(cytidine 5'-diphospho)-2-C-methyl-D-erythritol kinase [Pseudomonadota bacterium]
MTKPITLPAPAKINLFLHITGKRDDGYHLLESLMAFAGIGDRVTAEPAEILSLTIEGPFAAGLETGPGNLVLRAAEGLADLLGIVPRAHLILEKNLPVASGIGGGSADAASSLAVLCRLWKATPPRDALMKLALSLGADVPICLTGHAAIVRGIGEIIGPPIILPDVWLVLANPGIAVSTPEVFRARSTPFSAPGGEYDFSSNLIDALREQQNDLAAPAASLAPVIDQAVSELNALSGAKLSRLSGSGATAFAIFGTQAEAEQGAITLGERYPGWWIAAGPLLDRTDLANAFF